MVFGIAEMQLSCDDKKHTLMPPITSLYDAWLNFAISRVTYWAGESAMA